MKRKPIMPPIYLFVAILVMVGLHRFLPVRKVLVSPYNYAGVPALLVGLVLNVWCSGLFGKAKTTVKPFEQSSRLVTEGPYRYSRHPMYLGMALCLAGLAVLLGTVTPVLVVPVFVRLLGKKFIKAEERAMEETFGDAYREYKQRVRPWL